MVDWVTDGGVIGDRWIGDGRADIHKSGTDRPTTMPPNRVKMGNFL